MNNFFEDLDEVPDLAPEKPTRLKIPDAENFRLHRRRAEPGDGAAKENSGSISRMSLLRSVGLGVVALLAVGIVIVLGQGSSNNSLPLAKNGVSSETIKNLNSSYQAMLASAGAIQTKIYNCVAAPALNPCLRQEISSFEARVTEASHAYSLASSNASGNCKLDLSSGALHLGDLATVVTRFGSNITRPGSHISPSSGIPSALIEKIKNDRIQIARSCNLG